VPNKYYAKKRDGGMEVCNATFMTSAVDGGEWLANETVALPQGNSPTPDKRLSGLQRRSGHMEKRKVLPLCKKWTPAI
jgi:hypothetical protein